MKSWYPFALEILKNEISDSEFVEGFDFLQDFYLDHKEKYEEEILVHDSEDFAESNFEGFQSWITSEGGIKAGKTGRWFISGDDAEIKSSEFVDGIPVSAPSVSDYELRLLSLHQYDLNVDSYNELKPLVSKLDSLKDKRVVIASINLAKSAAQSGRNDSELVSLWSEAVNFCERHPGCGDIVYCLRESAYYNVKLSKHGCAAELYEKAANSCTDKDKVSLLRDARIQYQNAGDHDAASVVFVKKMNIKRDASDFYGKIFLYLFGFTSGYGESPKRVILNILGWLLFFTFVSFSTVVQLDGGSDEVFMSKVVDGFYYTIVTFTTLGYGDITPNSWTGKILSGLIAFLGLLYTSLLMVTVVRKYSRS